MLARYSDALAGLDLCLEEFHRLGDLEGLANSVALVGHAYFRSLQSGRGIARVRAFLDSSPVADVPPLALARVYSVLSALHWSIGGYPSQLACAEETMALAQKELETAEAQMVFAQGLTWRGVALGAMGRRDEAMAALERAATMAEETGDLNTVARALNSLGGVYEELGNLQQALEYTSRGLEAARQLGDPARTALMLARLSRCHLMRGEWQAARETIDQAAALPTDIGTSWAQPFVWLSLGWILFVQGDWEGACRALEDAAAPVEENGNAVVRWGAHAILAQIDLRLGRAGEARERLERFAGDPVVSDTDQNYLAVLLARVDLAEGDAAGALRRLDDLMDDARPKDPASLMEAIWVRAVAARALMRLEEAGKNFAEALEHARALEMPYQEAQVLIDWGESSPGEDDREAARQRVLEASEIFRHLGANKDLERAEELLSREVR